MVSTIVPWVGRKSSTTSANGHPGRAGSLSHQEEIRLQKHLRVVRIILLNVVAVLLMWLPITILMLLVYIDSRRPIDDTNFFLKSHHFIWTLIIAQLNTVMNPLLYGVFSENFRACFVKLWRSETRNGSGERGSGGQSTKKGGDKSLEALQGRLATKSGSFRRTAPKKTSSCSIGSIIEVPGSEKN